MRQSRLIRFIRTIFCISLTGLIGFAGLILLFGPIIPAYAAVRAGNSPVASIQNGLVGYWTMDGQHTNWATGKTFDQSGQANNGTMTSMSSTTSPVAGKFGQAFKFDGVDDYVKIATVPTLVAPYTTSFWFYPSKLGVTQGLFFYGLSSAGKGIYFTNANKIEIDSYSAGTFRTFCNKTFTATDLNKWHHLTIIITSATDASLWKCYLNSADVWVVDSNSSGTYANPGNTNWTIGTYYNNSNYFNGSIDDVRIYNRALSAGEIQKLYGLGR